MAQTILTWKGFSMDPITNYLKNIEKALQAGSATEHTHRPALKPLIEALGKKNDIAWGLSTSGNSKNVIQAIKAANEKEMFSIGSTGRGGALANCAQLVFAAESDDTARIQEAHITLGHILCDLVERTLFPDKY